tara:strand:- start:5265 stop:5879 length:615 start_codon:yes stop_codon:yes gene_type:complete
MIGLQNYYWLYKGLLPIETCKNIIAFCKNKRESQRGVTYHESQDPKTKDHIRESNVRWIDDEWIYNEILPFVHNANEQAGWNFNIDWNETIQFTEYKTNQYYGWHSDNFNHPFGEKHHPNFRGKIRKISVTVSLSDSDDYEGGDFELDYRNSSKGSGNHITTVTDARQQGSIIVFPSFVFHQVKPVIKGERNSLVLWCLGPTWN